MSQLSSGNKNSEIQVAINSLSKVSLSEGEIESLKKLKRIVVEQKDYFKSLIIDYPVLAGAVSLDMNNIKTAKDIAKFLYNAKSNRNIIASSVYFQTITNASMFPMIDAAFDLCGRLGLDRTFAEQVCDFPSISTDLAGLRSKLVSLPNSSDNKILQIVQKYLTPTTTVDLSTSSFQESTSASDVIEPKPLTSQKQPEKKFTKVEFLLATMAFLKGEPDVHRIIDNPKPIFRIKFSRGELVEYFDLMKDFFVDKVYDNGLSILAKALIYSKSPKDLEYIADTLVNKLLLNTTTSYYVSPEQESVTQEELVSIILERMKKFDDLTFKDAQNYVTLLPSPYQLYLFTEAVNQLENLTINERSLAFFQIATNMLYINEAERPIGSLLQRMIGVIDTYGHPNLAEVFLLMNPSPNEQHQVSSGVNLIRHFESSRHPELIWAMQRIGRLGFSFSRFKIEARRVFDKNGTVVSESLLSKIGGEFVPDPQKNEDRDIVRKYGPQPYGSQYFFHAGSLDFEYKVFNVNREQVERRFDSKTSLSLRQGYYLVANPSYGLLILRNSSPEFGRSLLSVPTLFIDQHAAGELTPDELKYPSLRLLDYAEWTGNFDDVRPVNFLLDELEGFLEYYYKCKCDTSSTAWDSDQKLIGGYRSPLFKDLVEDLKLRYAHKSASEFIELKFVHRDYPTWRSYEFKDREGNQQRSLILDQQVIAALELLVKEECPEEFLEATNIRAFFQEAGFDKEAELIISIDTLS